MITEKSGGRLPAGLAALGVRNYFFYFIGHFTTQLGTWIEMTALSWILYELTDSALLLGVSGLCRAAPMILLGLVGGAVADRVARRTLIVWTESTMLSLSVGMGALAALGYLEFWHIYVLNLANGTLNAFSVPARQALFPTLVPATAVQSAVTLNTVAARSAAFIGPMIAGLALAAGGYAAPFFLNAFSFLGMIAALLAMRLPPDMAPARNRPSMWHGMTDGLGFVWKNPTLKALLALELVAGLFGHNTALITIIAKDALDLGPTGLGALLGALGAGALFGMAFMLAFHPQRWGRVILAAGSMYAALFAVFGLSPIVAVSMAALFALGASDGVWGVTRNTVAQLVVPDALRGRIMSVVVLVTRGSAPLGHLQSGFIASLIGGPGTVVCGAAVIAAGLFGYRSILSTLRSDSAATVSARIA
jgi:hypothetical protein